MVLKQAAHHPSLPVAPSSHPRSSHSPRKPPPPPPLRPFSHPSLLSHCRQNLCTSRITVSPHLLERLLPSALISHNLTAPITPASTLLRPRDPHKPSEHSARTTCVCLTVHLSSIIRGISHLASALALSALTLLPHFLPIASLFSPSAPLPCRKH